MAGFWIPLFRKVPEPPRVLESDERLGERAITVAFAAEFEAAAPDYVAQDLLDAAGWIASRA